MASATAPPDVNRAIPGLPLSNIIFCIAACVVVVIRIFTRVLVKASAGWDDVLIVVAMVLAIAYVALKMVQVYNGHYGHHLVYLTGEQFKLVAQLNVALNVIDPAAVFFARASICAFLFRMIGDIRKWALGIGLAMLLNAVVFIGTSIIFGVQCVPLRHRYDPLSPGKCINLVYFDNVVRVFSALNCVVDFICALVPFFALRHIQIDKRTKMGVFTILGCGLVTAGCSIGRAVTLDFASPDETYALIPWSYWLDGELFGAIIFASLPALHQLFSHYTTHGTLKKVGKPSYHSRKPSAPIFTSSTAEGGLSKVKAHGREEIACQTDVYVELDDVENARPETLGGRVYTPGYGTSLDDLRGHAA